MSHGLVLLAGGASFNIVHYPLFHPGPLGIFMHLSEGFIPSRVSGGRVVMVNGHQGMLFEEREVTLDPIDLEFIFWDQCYVLIVPGPMVRPRRAQ